MKAHYGIDAPIVVRNLILFLLLALVLCAFSFLTSRIWFWCIFLGSLLSAVSILVSLCWMLFSSLSMKPKIIQLLLSSLDLKGDEKLLDVGCGRGLVLIEAAKLLPHGRVCGVDLWTQDQSGNTLQATLNNARAEHLDMRIDLQTADVRSLPYSDHSFDAVVSSLVIHNIPTQEGREQALREMLRVLKPSGRFAIFDLHYGPHYIEFLSDKAHLSTQKTVLAYCPTGYLIMGQKAAK